jgi:hypothetical protein
MLLPDREAFNSYGSPAIAVSSLFKLISKGAGFVNDFSNWSTLLGASEIVLGLIKETDNSRNSITAK